MSSILDFRGLYSSAAYYLQTWSRHQYNNNKEKVNANWIIINNHPIQYTIRTYIKTIEHNINLHRIKFGLVGVMVCNATFKNISVISW